METKRSIPFVNLLTSWLNALVKPYFMLNFSIYYAVSLFLSYPVFCQMKVFVVCGANNMILVIIVLIVTDLER